MKYEYLERFFKTPRGLAGPAHIAKQFGVTRQAVNNWKQRKVIPQEIQDKVRELRAAKK
jgi:hypothetical protein